MADNASADSEAAGLVGQIVLGEYRLERLVREDDALATFSAVSTVDSGPYSVTLATRVAVDTSALALEAAVGRIGRHSVGIRGLIPVLHARPVALASGRSCLGIVRRGEPGQSLRDEILRGPKPVHEVARWLGPVVSSVMALHEQGISHGVIASSSICIRNDEVLLDLFGLSAAAEAASGSRGSRDTLPIAYRPPEMDGPFPPAPGPWTDAYAIALLACELMVGRAGIHMISEGSARPTAPTPRALNVEVSGRVEERFTRVLSSNPAIRPLDLRDLLRLLETMDLSDDVVPAPRSSRAYPQPYPPQGATVAGGWGATPTPPPAATSTRTPGASGMAGVPLGMPGTGGVGGAPPSTGGLGSPGASYGADRGEIPTATPLPGATLQMGAAGPQGPASTGSGQQAPEDPIARLESPWLLRGLLGTASLLMLGGIVGAIWIVSAGKPVLGVTPVATGAPTSPTSTSGTPIAPTGTAMGTGGPPGTSTAPTDPDDPDDPTVGSAGAPGASLGPRPVLHPTTYPADESAMLPIQRDAAIRGDREAEITMVIFGDLTCPNTARFLHTVPQLERVYGDTLRIVYKHYPLPGRVGAMQAAEAAATARVKGGNDAFWKLVDGASKTPELLDAGRLEELGIKAGLPAGTLTEGMTKHVDAPLVERDIQVGRRLGVRGTPVIFFNGKRIDGYRPPEVMRELLDAEKERVEAIARTGMPADRVYATRVVTNITTSEGDLTKK